MHFAETPKWRFEIVGTSIRLHVANAPNLFHRLMQRLLLGFRWERL